MRLATARIDGATSAIRVDGDRAAVLPFADVGALLASGPGWRELAAAGGAADRELAGLELAQPVLRPEKVICVGLNYATHVRETGREIPAYPTLFAKFWRSLIGPTDPLVLPSNSDRVDWEAEVALVVGREVRHADEATALDAIAGYTVANDVSMRDWQVRTVEMLQGKAFEASTPVGPFVVTGDELGDASDLALGCSIDGETMQSSTTADLVFGPAALIAYISAFITLAPGDLILTGTPAGIGAVRKPPRFLAGGETLRTTVAGIGELVNPVVAPA